MPIPKGVWHVTVLIPKLAHPSYKEVAAKGESAEVLTASIKNGSKGKWGETPMPAQTLTDEEAKLVEWVLNKSRSFRTFLF